ncbi:hypothetical protein [Micromonospora siamensis]|uniref:Excreted virulence factor EspC, type VII ESX diderm n=1 Tax=Micromonospora siamensis TaxID=299152 RepID=A0A1C5K5E3_9ACTN|nr:hypothetical protein [Micromonospora siamensis]SCG78003.1 hypothetical protein GA0074704_5554 [Micromonospora siamensis]
MIEEPLSVRPGVLHEVAGGLDGVAYRLVRGLAGGLPPGPTPDGWQVDAALADLTAAVHAWAGARGARLAESAGGLRCAADGYRAADERAAGRLSGVDR